MAKKFNYFDDEPVEEQEKKNNEKKCLIISLKDILVSIGIGILVVFGKIRGFIKPAYKQNGLFQKTKDDNEDYTESDFDDDYEGSSEPSIFKGIIVFLIAVVLLVVIAVIGVINSTARINRHNSDFKEDAGKVCAEYNEKYGIANYKYMSEYEVKGYMLTGLCVVREVDFDNNGKSELLLAYNDNDEYYEEIWGYYRNDFIKLYKAKLPQSDNKNDDIWMTIYSKNDKFYIAEQPLNSKKVIIKRLAGDEFKEKGSATYDADNFTYKIKSQNATDSFEPIKMCVLKEHIASSVVDRTLDTTDSFLGKVEVKKPNSVSTTSSMEGAYLDIINTYTEKYGKAEYVSNSKMPYINGLAGVNLVDFDGDKTDELVLVYRRTVSQRDEDSSGNYISIEEDKYSCDIYYWNGKNVQLAYQTESIGNLLNNNDSAYYIIKTDGNRRFFCYNTFTSENYNNLVTASSKMMRFNGTNFEQEFKASYRTEYGYTKYYIDGESKYKNSFVEQGGYSIPFFDGSDEFDSEKWQVCFLQGKKEWETNIKTQLDKTESTIKSLEQKASK